jgi:hypothetical protein
MDGYSPTVTNTSNTVHGRRLHYVETSVYMMKATKIPTPLEPPSPGYTKSMYCCQHISTQIGAVKDSVYEITTDIASLYSQDYTVLSCVVFVKFPQRGVTL